MAERGFIFKVKLTLLLSHRLEIQEIGLSLLFVS